MDIEEDDAGLEQMLGLIDRLGGKPGHCPGCGSTDLATLLPADYPRHQAARRAVARGRAALARDEHDDPDAPSGPDAPVWRCRHCGREIPRVSDAPKTAGDR